ncbi:putative kinase [Streptomyces sp. CZ24]|nr:putative kinase [Streptomyces sp. CZ24]
MRTTCEGTMHPLDTTIPDRSLVVLIGAAGAGESTWARTWLATQVLELDSSVPRSVTTSLSSSAC